MSLLYIVEAPKVSLVLVLRDTTKIYSDIEISVALAGRTRYHHYSKTMPLCSPVIAFQRLLLPSKNKVLSCVKRKKTVQSRKEKHPCRYSRTG